MHTYSGLLFSAFRKFAPATACGYFPYYGKTGFSLLVSCYLLSHDVHIYWSPLFSGCDTCPKHCDTTKHLKS